MSNISAPTLTSSLPTQPSKPATSPSQAPRICVFCSTQPGLSPINVTAATSLAGALHARGIELVYGGGSSGLMGAVARERVRLGGVESVMGVIPYALVGSERGGKGREGIPGAMAISGDPAATEGKDGTPSSRSASAGATGVKGKLRRMFGTSTGTGTTSTNEDQEAQGDGEADAENRKETWQTWSDVYALPADATYGRVVGTPSLARRKAVMMDLVRHGGAGSGYVALPGGFGSLDEVLTVLTARQLGQHAQPVVLVDVDGFWAAFEAWMDAAVAKGFLGAESRSYVRVVASVEEAVEWLVSGAGTVGAGVEITVTDTDAVAAGADAGAGAGASVTS